MYTSDFKQYVQKAWCAHLINGGSHECEATADKCWVYLDEDSDMRLQIMLAVPVCKNHAYSMRHSIIGALNRGIWELVDRRSDSWNLVLESLEK